MAASRRHSSNKDTQGRTEEERLDRKKENLQRREIFLLFYFFIFSPIRHGTAIAPQQQRQSIDSRSTQGIWGETTEIGKSSHHFEVLLHKKKRGDSAQFFIFSRYWCYTRHLAASRRHSSTKDTQSRIEQEKVKQKRQCGSERRYFSILFISYPSSAERPRRHSSSKKRRDGQSKRREAPTKA